jgi:outer membrane protein OmpA-like peptidoglycan-associated protein
MRFLFSFLALVPSLALADSVNVQLYRPPFNLNYGMTESAIHDNAPWEEKSFDPKIFGAIDYSYVKSPLVTIDTTTNTRVNTLVNYVHTLDVSGGYFVSPGLSLYAQLPIAYSNSTALGSGVNLEDSRIAAKFSLGEPNASTSFTLMPELTLPTGNQNRFLSDAGVGVGLLLIAEHDFAGLRLTGNAGYRYSASATSPGIDYRNRIPLGVGAAIPLAKQWLLNLEGNGSLALPTAQKQNASEFYGGVSYAQKKYVTWMAGLALGAFDQVGSSSYRLLAGVRVYFDQPAKAAPRVDEPTAAPAPPPQPKPKVVRMAEDKSHIEILEEIQFDNNKDTLKKRGKEILDEVADVIRQHDSAIKNIEVEGHTSHTGTFKHNMDLSWRRARAVISYLIHEQKIPATMLTPKGYGWTHPKDLKHLAAAENRRVEFKVTLKKN